MKQEQARTLSRRRTSFGDSISKFTRKSLNRRRTNTLFLSTSTNTLSVSASQVPPVPTTKFPRSISLLSNISNRQAGSKIPQPAAIPRSESPDFIASRRISHHFRKPSVNSKIPTPVQESPRSSNKRDSDAQIQQHTLLKPVQPPMPKSQTYGDLSGMAGRLPPRFMRPTSSSAARQSGRTTRLQRLDPPPTYTEAEKRDEKISETARGLMHTLEDLGLEDKVAAAKEENISPPIPSGKRLSNVSSSGYGLSSAPQSRRRSHLFMPWKRMSGIGTAITNDKVEPLQIELDFGFSDAASASSDLIVRSEPNPRKISRAQTTPYWLGRVTALSDRFRTEALEAAQHNGSRSCTPSPEGGSTSFVAMYDNTLRLNRVWAHLRALCATAEARLSLEDFKEMYEARWTDAGELRPRRKDRGRWSLEQLGFGRRNTISGR